jgi:hypothetical protein
MTEPTPQPRDSDATLGGQTPPPNTGAILGGLEGAKQRLESEALAARMAALKDSLKYGDQGLELLIQALSDPEEQVQRFACRLLKNHEQGREALLEHRPLDYFKTLADWRWETYNPQVGITDPENNAYVVRMGSPRSRGASYDLSAFESLLKDPNVSQLQALIFQIDYYRPDRRSTFDVALKAICDAKDKLAGLKALFLGDSEGDRAPEFKKSKIGIYGINAILKNFKNLEVLQLFGYFVNDDYRSYSLDCAGLHYTKLESLIIETADISQNNIEQLCTMDLPNLEYFQLWFGRQYQYDSAVQPLRPIFEGSIYPGLKYLGLCSSEESSTLTQEMLGTPLLRRLAVLDLRMGFGANREELLNASQNKNLVILLDSSDYSVWVDEDGCTRYHSEGDRHYALYE